MLFLIGLGLHDLNDITVKGLELVRRCDKVFLDSYTSILSSHSKAELEAFLKKEVILAYRDTVEDDNNAIISAARTSDTAFLVVGDPLGATTHSDLILRAMDEGIPYQVVHNASIMNAVSCTGLQLYRFGETVTLCLWDDFCRPDSYFDRIEANLARGLHTLCLLDIRVREPTTRSLLSGRPEFAPPRYMLCHEAAAQLREIGRQRTVAGAEVRLTEAALAVGLARVGGAEQCVRAMALEDMAERPEGDLGPPLHSLVVPGRLHPLEADFVRRLVPPGIDSEARIKAHAALCDRADTCSAPKPPAGDE